MSDPRHSRYVPGFQHNPTGGGYTLVELLLVMAVILLLGTLLLPGVTSLLKGIGRPGSVEAVWEAIGAAREQALLAKRTVALRYDAEGRQLTWTDGVIAHRSPMADGVTVQVLRPKAGATILLGGQLIETEEVPVVKFYPDGTCDDFRIQIREGSALVKTVRVDPWTCAPVFTGIDKP